MDNCLLYPLSFPRLSRGSCPRSWPSLPDVRGTGRRRPVAYPGGDTPEGVLPNSDLFSYRQYGYRCVFESPILLTFRPAPFCPANVNQHRNPQCEAPKWTIFFICVQLHKQKCLNITRLSDRPNSSTPQYNDQLSLL